MRTPRESSTSELEYPAAPLLDTDGLYEGSFGEIVMVLNCAVTRAVATSNMTRSFIRAVSKPVLSELLKVKEMPR